MNSAKINGKEEPNPCLVQKVFVSEGDIIKKDDNHFMLEAMEMENIIKDLEGKR
ncbi:hypothetical protein ACFFGT_25380 [Mucilaginibacter angelicae]|uniref:Acetyl-CoA carboxylase biotin carboxyl carrier protein subunit n=1 Tax=Mucilaginibacter angelicae TaxID=869718 RepID=A0ABV6LDL0_9SPHI